MKKVIKKEDFEEKNPDLIIFNELARHESTSRGAEEGQRH